MTSKLLFLLRHEWRLALRQIKGIGWLLGIIAFLFVGSVVGAFFIPKSPQLLELDLSTNLAALLLASGSLLLGFSLLLSSTIANSVQILFERNDIDLLLSSPLETRVVLFSRGLWLALSGFLALGVFIVPASVLLSAVLGLRALGVIAVLVALAFLAAGVGLLITLGLVRWLGARRARTVAQVMGVLTGAAFYLVTQLGRFITPENFPFLGTVQAFLNGLEPQSILFLPAKAVWFDPLGLLVLFALGIGVFWSSVQLTQRSFLRGMTSSVVGGAVKPPREIAKYAGVFWQNTFRKEWRLILRDPMLISQTLLQILYLLPMFFVFLGGRSGANPLATFGTYPLLVTAAILIGGTLATNIVQIMVAAEDAPELLRMSPQNSQRIRSTKIFAALLPIWAVFVPLIIWRGVLEPISFFVLFGFVAVTISGSLMVIWTAKPFSRTDFRQNQRQTNMWVGLGLFLLMLAWAAVLLLPLWVPFWWSGLPLVAGLAIPFITYAFTGAGEQLAY